MLSKYFVAFAVFTVSVTSSILPNYTRRTNGVALAGNVIVGTVISAAVSEVGFDGNEDSEDTPEVDPELDLPSPNLDAVFSVPDSDFGRYETGGLVREDIDFSNTTEFTTEAVAAWVCNKKATSTNGDKVQGKGISVTNGDSVKRGFYIYHNSCDQVPFKYIWIPAGKTRYVELPANFEGRITRGDNKWNLGGVARPLGTWFEFSFDSGGVAWGDVSLIRGCDGAVAMWSTDDLPQRHTGFRQWILDGAPEKAYAKKPSGAKVIGPTEGKDASINTVPRNYVLNKVGADHAYVDDSHAKPVINSQNGRFGVWFGRGRI
ncbi:hypothetical protein F5Y19DRAFT_490685 [Xylariaceae sp. FL1651]|nr:hypothetical protein F5Y19DRAFT_490685 [Xylariaceae sp. FL1651]